jgi:hypothetical protein
MARSEKRLLVALSLAVAPFFAACATAGPVVYNQLLSSTFGGTATSCSPFSTSCTNIPVNNAVFAVAPANTGAGSGAGAFNPFLRLENANANDTFETGYNTSARSYKPNGDYLGPATASDPKPGNKTQFQELDDPKTRNVVLGTLETVTFNGQQYFELLLDVNEPNPSSDPNKVLLSLQSLQLFVGTSPYLDMYSGGGLTGATKIWDLDDSTYDRQITIDPIVSPGSGSYDLVALFPIALLAPFVDNATTTYYFYLYNQLGNVDNMTPQCIPSVTAPNGCSANAGFEEWAYLAKAYTPPGPPPPQPDVPEPATLALLGLGLFALGASRVRKH